MAQTGNLKNLPVMLETPVRSLGQEDPLEKEMATHSNILTWEIPWTEEPGGLQSTGLQRVKHNVATKQKPPQIIIQSLISLSSENSRLNPGQSSG